MTQPVHATIAFVHAVVILQVDPNPSNDDLLARLVTCFGPNDLGARARELSSRWRGSLLYGREGPTFAIFCIRNVDDQLQFHLERGSDDIWKTTDTTWKQVRRHLKDWKPRGDSDTSLRTRRTR